MTRIVRKMALTAGENLKTAGESPKIAGNDSFNVRNARLTASGESQNNVYIALTPIAETEIMARMR